MGLNMIFLVLALISFSLKALNVNIGGIDLQNAGFAFVTASLIV